MHVKKYQATTMQQALDQVRADLGRDAVILNTRMVPRRGFLGFRRQPLVEIYASADVPVRPAGPRIPGAGLGDPRRNAPEGPATQALLSELEALRKQVDGLATQREDAGSFPIPLRSHYRQLVERGVNAALARRYLRRIHDQFAASDLSDALKVRLQLVDLMRETIRTTDGFRLKHDRPTVIALVGPTGVGKTTTIAKLAAQFAITERRRVGLVTADTYRIAAVEQLRVYAEIMDLPLEVVLTPAELQAALNRFHDKDVILVDTAGRSPLDSVKLHELEAVIKAAAPDYAALCLSATTHSDDVMRIVERFGVVPISNVILTKLDETERPGWILNTCINVDAPVVYLTTGQSVPDDIEPADATRLVGRILGEGVQA